MKTKFLIVLIFLSSLALIGIIGIAIDNTTNIHHQELVAHAKDEHSSAVVTQARSTLPAPASDIADTNADNIFSDIGAHMPREDEEKINKIAALSADALEERAQSLKSLLIEKDYFTRLENQDLSPSQVVEAKKVLEEFALLGLEKTRRKFMSIEPDLRDPLFAHRESLKEIREILSGD